MTRSANEGAFVQDLDSTVRELCGQGDYDRATAKILTEIGGTVYRFIAARVRDDTLASDAFARFSEDLWRGMASFAGRSDVKVWAYAIARNSAGQEQRKRVRELRRSTEFTSSVSHGVAEKVRTETQEYLRTDFKRRFQLLTERLSPEEQALLVLRVNQRLSWEEIAKVNGDAPDAATVKREAARLRKRFQLVREKLRELAEEEGLISKEDD